MKGKYFSGTVLKKDITRFAPVWGLYTIFMLLFLFVMWDAERSRFAIIARSLMQMMGGLNLVYGGLTALVLFGDLFQSRMGNALHAMPMRREGWFFTHITAGLLFSVVPNLLGAVLASLIMENLAFLAYVWLGCATLSFVFYFAVAVFSCLCAGNRIGAVAVYGIVNFLAVIVSFFAKLFYEPLLYGVELDISKYFNFSPVIALTQGDYVNVSYDYVTETVLFKGYGSQIWVYLFVAAGVGLVFGALALLLYRKRHLETAGDFVAVKAAAPVFLTIYSLGVGALLYAIGESMSSSAQYAFLLIGLALGFFTGKMLLERRVKVFSKKNFIGFAGLLAAFLVSLGITVLDPLGLETYVPKAESVESVTISPYSSYYYQNGNHTLYDEEDIEEIIRLHKLQISQRTGGVTTFRITYQMKNGTRVTRSYEIFYEGEVAQALKPLYSRPEAVFGGKNAAGWALGATRLEFYSYSERVPNVIVSAEDATMEELREKFGDDKTYILKNNNGTVSGSEVVKGLLAAMEKDCLEGNMAQAWDYHQSDEHIGSLIIQGTSVAANREILIWESCRNTYNYLQYLATQAAG